MQNTIAILAASCLACLAQPTFPPQVTPPDFYGVPPFTSDFWYYDTGYIQGKSYDAVPYDWNNSVDAEGGPSCRLQPVYGHVSDLFNYEPNTFTAPGQPLPYMLSFWYRGNGRASGSEQLWIELNGSSQPYGPYLYGTTNRWRFVSYNLNAVNIPELEIYFYVSMNDSLNSQYFEVDAVSLLPVYPQTTNQPPPPSATPGLTATLTTNGITLRWPATDEMLSAPAVTGPWGFTGAPVSVSNGWATTTLPATNSAQFFKIDE